MTCLRETLGSSIACAFLLIFFIAGAEAEEISVRVKKVIDGDTIDILIPEKNRQKRDTVRLIGIDAPESRPNNKAERDSLRSGKDLSIILEQGKRSAEFLTRVVSIDSTLRLEFDLEKRDRYGRYLAYAYLPDGRMLNELIVASGYASLLTIPPNVKYVERFSSALKSAQKGKLGLWK